MVHKRILHTDVPKGNISTKRMKAINASYIPDLQKVTR